MGSIFAVAAIVLPAAVLHAALPGDSDTSGRTSFAGRLLIASPEMGEPFDHAVILMAQHNRDGALGIVINHPLERRSICAWRDVRSRTGWARIAKNPDRADRLHVPRRGSHP